jgi:hypothetical protein
MPIRLNQRSREVIFLLLRLAIFAAVTWWAIEWILLRGVEEREVQVIAAEGITAKFRTLGPMAETNGFSVFGQTVLKVTQTREEVQSGKRRAGRAGGLVWVKEGDEFYPAGRSGATFTTEGTNFVDYTVLAPEAAEWMFKVEHQIRREYVVGPFRFELRPRHVIYKSPVMRGETGRQDSRRDRDTRQSSVVE